MSPRTAVTRCVTGLTSTKRCSTTGIVDGSTKMFDANVSGMSTSIDVPMTALGERSTSPSAVNTQLSANANTSSSTIPRTTPTTPPGGRKPSTRPSARVTTEAIV
ncbi:Uncharacterised protein [Mycobacteroides abscessus]|nr:Uncharacterised protein [Mycobacteroides abscessus]